MKKSSFVVGLVGLTLVSSSAFAQDAGTEAAPAEGSEAAPAEAAPAEAAPADSSAAPAADVGGQSYKGVPIEIIDRPRALPKGLMQLGGDLAIARTSVTVAGKTTSSTGAALGLSFGYGVADKLAVGVGYSFALKEFEAKGDLSLFAAYSFMENSRAAKMSAAATVGLGYNILGESLDPIELGVDFHYKLTPKMELFSGGGQLQIGIDPDTTASLSLPVGFGFQASPNLWAFAQTSLATIGLKPSGTTLIGRDFTPLSLGAYYSPSAQLDVGASFNTVDLGGVADAFSIVFSGRYRM